MNKILILFTLLTVAPSQASIVGTISKKVSNAFKSTKPSIDLVAQGKILESNMDNLIIRTNSEMGKGVILEDISSKIIEAEFRGMDMSETLEELSLRSFNDRFLTTILKDQMRKVATISAHNHLLLKKMSKEERSQYLLQHKKNVSSALNDITSKISASGTYSYVSFKALRNIYMDLNSL